MNYKYSLEVGHNLSAFFLEGRTKTVRFVGEIWGDGRKALVAIPHMRLGGSPLQRPNSASYTAYHVHSSPNSRPGGPGCAQCPGGSALPTGYAVLHPGGHGSEGRPGSPGSGAQRHQEHRPALPARENRGQPRASGPRQARRPLRSRHRRCHPHRHRAGGDAPSADTGVSRRAVAVRRSAPDSGRFLRGGETGEQRRRRRPLGGARQPLCRTGAAYRRGRLSGLVPARCGALAASRRAAGAGAPCRCYRPVRPPALRPSTMCVAKPMRNGRWLWPPPADTTC